MLTVNLTKNKKKFLEVQREIIKKCQFKVKRTTGSYTNLEEFNGTSLLLTATA